MLITVLECGKRHNKLNFPILMSCQMVTKWSTKEEIEAGSQAVLIS